MRKLSWGLLVLAGLATLALSQPRRAAVGPLYPVTEPDLLAHITEALELAVTSGELAAHRLAARQRASAFVAAPPPVTGLVAATVAVSRLFDPTVRLRRAVTGPDGVVVHPAGTAINPLDKVRLEGRLVLFDGRVPAQVEFAARLLREPGRTRVVLTGGSPGEFAKVSKGRVYFDQDGTLSRRLALTHLPAVVRQEGRMLRIDTVALAATGVQP